MSSSSPYIWYNQETGSSNTYLTAGNTQLQNSKVLYDYDNKYPNSKIFNMVYGYNNTIDSNTVLNNSNPYYFTIPKNQLWTYISFSNDFYLNSNNFQNITDVTPSSYTLILNMLTYINIPKDSYYTFGRNTGYWQPQWSQRYYISINNIPIVAIANNSEINLQNPIYLKKGKYLYNFKYFLPIGVELGTSMNLKYAETDSKGNIISGTIADIASIAEKIPISSIFKNNKNIAYKNFCNAINSTTGKANYETDTTNCSSVIPELSYNRCIKANVFQDTDSYCINYSNNNIADNTSTYISDINKARKIKAIVDYQNGLASSTYIDKKILTNDTSYDYLLNKYPTTGTIYNPDDVIIPELTTFCENYDKDYLKNPNGQCAGFYKKYNNNTKIKNSRDRMRIQLCRDQNNINTNITDDGTTNAYKCADLVFNKSLNDSLIYSSDIATYCQTSNNITTDLCKNYYSNIEELVFDELGFKHS